MFCEGMSGEGGLGIIPNTWAWDMGGAGQGSGPIDLTGVKSEGG